MTIIPIPEERDFLLYDELLPILLQQPNYVVYIELNGLLYGIITMPRIRRSGIGHVQINKNYVADRLESCTYMHLRQHFQKDSTHFVNFVPVIDSYNRLVGEWSRWNDYLSKDLSALRIEQPAVIASIKELQVALVRPSPKFYKKQELFLFWKELFEQKGVSLEAVSPQEIKYCKNVDAILFVDYPEAESIRAYFHMISTYGNRSFDLSKFMSCQEWLLNKCSSVYGQMEKIFQSLSKENVTILAFDFLENEHGYLKKFQQQLREKGCQNLLLSPEMAPGFLCELYAQYKEIRFPLPMSSLMTQDGFRIIADTKTPLLQVSQGKRQTTDQPETYERCIYLCGPCIIAGSYVDDQHTISSLLQKELNAAQLPCKVVNLGVPGLEKPESQIAKALKENIKYGDVIVFYSCCMSFHNIQTLNLTNALEENHPPIEWFLDQPIHCNHKVNQIYAKAIYQKLFPTLELPVIDRKSIREGNNVIIQSYINRYFSNFNPIEFKTIGSIVMNCNPFTFGHRHLIEYAASQVDLLIIFVVEEDASIFTFEERFSMVCRGTDDLKNIMVVPSGEFILSKLSFPEYFIKEADENIIENTENDITLFAEKIAPILGITHRFVGEEPEDEVTNTYNQAMKRILPAHGIQFVEIPRKQKEKKVISASCVRRCLEENDLDQLNALVPNSTQNILFFQNQ